MGGESSVAEILFCHNRYFLLEEKEEERGENENKSFLDVCHSFPLYHQNSIINAF